MNLNQTVAGVIRAVNPQVLASLRASTGYGVDDDFHQIPTYADAVEAYVQVQPLDAGDLKQLDGLTIQGEMRKVWLNGKWDSLVRTEEKGGDLISFPADTPNIPNGTEWVFTHVFEYWAGWTSAAITLQVTPEDEA